MQVIISYTHTHTHTILPPLPVPSVLGRALRITFIFFIFFPPLQAPSVLGRALRLTFIFFYFFCLQCKRPPSWVAPRSQKGSSQAALSEHGDRERGWQPWTSRPAAFSHSRFPDGAPCLGASTCGSGPSNTLGTR